MGKLIAGILAAVLLVGGGIGYFVIKVNVQNTGLRMEKHIVNVNNDNTIQLNQYVASLKEQLGIANLKSQQIDKILKDAVSSQFSTSQVNDPNAKGSLFSALHEAYPTIDVNQYDGIIKFVMDERHAYQGVQKDMQKLLADFDVWRGSFPNSIFTGFLPDHWLVCQNDDGKQLTGQACEDYLNTISQPNGSNNGGGQRPVEIPGLNK